MADCPYCATDVPAPDDDAGRRACPTCGRPLQWAEQEGWTPAAIEEA